MWTRLWPYWVNWKGENLLPRRGVACQLRLGEKWQRLRRHVGPRSGGDCRPEPGGKAAQHGRGEPFRRQLDERLPRLNARDGRRLGRRSRSNHVACPALTIRMPAILANRGHCFCYLDRLNVLSLPALGALGDIELHGLAFLQAAEAARLNRRKVHKDILAILTAYKTIALG